MDTAPHRNHCNYRTRPALGVAAVLAPRRHKKTLKLSVLTNKHALC